MNQPLYFYFYNTLVLFIQKRENTPINLVLININGYDYILPLQFMYKFNQFPKKVVPLYRLTFRKFAHDEYKTKIIIRYESTSTT